MKKDLNLLIYNFETLNARLSQMIDSNQMATQPVISRTYNNSNLVCRELKAALRQDSFEKLN